ncbi:MAG: response regulator transcription factor [Turneriella sp.]|nr:response regulator transcription factor [Turneriella sp.]
MEAANDAKILVIEDDANTRDFLRRGLQEAGYRVEIAGRADAGLEQAKQIVFDVIILDIMLPDGDGMQICKNIRQADERVPILFLTALGTTEKITAGLDAGADDYLVKPFKFAELLARIRTLLRRVRPVSGQPSPEQTLVFADIQLDDYTKTVKRASQALTLTATEYRLLFMFLKNPGKVISRTEILNEIWGADIHIGSNVVDVYINYLRKKLEAGGLPRLIHTVIGMGYSLKEADENQS